MRPASPGLQAAALAAAERRATLLPQGLALLFELALQAADEGTATAVLAELLRHGHARDAARRPRARLARRHRVHRRPRHRAAAAAGAGPASALAAAGHLGAACRASGPAPARCSGRPCAAAGRTGTQQCGPSTAAARAPVPAAAGEPLQALQALDSAWSLVDQGGDAVPALRPMMTPDLLAGPTLGRAVARQRTLPRGAGRRRRPGAGAGPGAPPRRRPAAARGAGRGLLPHDGRCRP
jgi:hypothetical protein